MSEEVNGETFEASAFPFLEWLRHNYDSMPPHLQAWTDILTENKRSYETSQVILFSELMSYCLGELLRRHLRDGETTRHALDNNAGMLRHLFPRASMCYMMKIIDKTIYTTIKDIGDIRNEIAHAYRPMDLSVPHIQARISQLYDKLGGFASLHPWSTERHEEPAMQMFSIVSHTAGELFSLLNPYYRTVDNDDAAEGGESGLDVEL